MRKTSNQHDIVPYIITSTKQTRHKNTIHRHLTSYRKHERLRKKNTILKFPIYEQEQYSPFALLCIIKVVLKMCMLKLVITARRF